MIIRIVIFWAVSAVLFFSVYHFVKWYARKLNAEILGDAAERKELLRQAREGERLAKSAVKEYGKIKKSM